MAEPELAGYHSLVRIGSGGLGDVFRGVDQATGATVAIKVLRDVSDASVAWHRTRRELTALETLRDHPNVIRSIELLELERQPALVMEYAPGGSVADLLDDQRSPSRRRLAVDQTVFVGRQTARALIAAHAEGIVHRDIKPQNLLIDGDGQVKLCDFGIATLTADDRYRSCTNAVSMRYSSPEDLEHDDPVGPAADIYSLGATLLHLVHGAPPTLRDRLTPWEPPPTNDPDLAALDAAIASCLDPAPARRPTAAQLLQLLDDCVLDSGRKGVSELPVVDRVLPLITFDDVPIAFHEALTLQPPKRPGEAIERERPLMLERPKVDGSRRAAVIAAATTAAAVLLVVGALAALRVITASDAARATGPVTTPRPPGLPPLLDTDWSPGTVGDCLAQLDDSNQLTVTPCANPHDLQRYHQGSLPSEMQAAEAAKVVDATCASEFEAFVGNQPADSALDVAQSLPSTESWQAGDRVFQCYLGLRGRRIIGPAQGSDW